MLFLGQPVGSGRQDDTAAQRHSVHLLQDDTAAQRHSVHLLQVHHVCHCGSYTFLVLHMHSSHSLVYVAILFPPFVFFFSLPLTAIQFLPFLQFAFVVGMSYSVCGWYKLHATSLKVVVCMCEGGGVGGEL